MTREHRPDPMPNFNAGHEHEPAVPSVDPDVAAMSDEEYRASAQAAGIAPISTPPRTMWAWRRRRQEKKALKFITAVRATRD